MKRICLIILFFLNFSYSYALNFNENISSYSSKNKGVTSMIYVFNRCAGVTGYLHSMLEKEPGEQKTSNIYLNISAAMSSRAAELYSKHNKVDNNKSVDESLKRAVNIMQLYQADSKENFIKSGNYLTGIVKQDLEYCVLIEKEFRK